MANFKLPGEYIYEGIVLSGWFKKESIERIANMTFVDGDVLIASYPKTGTTWMEEVAWCITKQGDVTEANSEPLDSRILFLELSDVHTSPCLAGIDRLKDKPRPTIMKTHLLGSILGDAIKEGRVKVIMTVRNPKDTLVSFYHFYKSFNIEEKFTGSWNDFFELYKAKHLLFGDFFDWYVSWFPFLDLPNVQLIAYEDMKADITSVIHRLSSFLGKSLSDDQVKTIVQHTSFKSMKENKMTNFSDTPDFRQDVSPFMRKGEVGDWKNYFSEEQSQYVDDQYKAKFEKQGLVLKFNLHAEK